MWQAILSGIQFVGSLLGLIAQKDAQANEADVKAAKEAQDTEDERARITADVSKGDIDEIRKDIAES
jgi:hypothetical protein